MAIFPSNLCDIYQYHIFMKPEVVGYRLSVLRTSTVRKKNRQVLINRMFILYDFHRYVHFLSPHIADSLTTRK